MKRRAAGSGPTTAMRPATSSRTSTMSGTNPSPFTLRALVDHSTRGWGGLSPDGPRPRRGVHVADPALATSPIRAAVHAAKITTSPPAGEVVRRAGYQSVCEQAEGRPVGQRKRARVVKFVFRTLKLPLPTAHSSWVPVNDPVAVRLLHHSHQRSQAVLHRRAAAAIRDPAMDGAVNGTGRDHPYREVTEGRHNPLAPPRQVRVEGLGFEAAQRQHHVRCAVVGESHGCCRGIETTKRGSMKASDPLDGSLFGLEGLRLRFAALGRRVDPAHSRPERGPPVGPVLDVGRQRDTDRGVTALIRPPCQGRRAGFAASPPRPAHCKRLRGPRAS